MNAPNRTAETAKEMKKWIGIGKLEIASLKPLFDRCPKSANEARRRAAPRRTFDTFGEKCVLIIMLIIELD